MDRRSNSSSSSKSRIDGVDLLRALAIVFVLMNHIAIRLGGAKVPYRQGMTPTLVHDLFFNGQNGVRIFFAVSGFLITSMSLRRFGALQRIESRQFYIFRFARIAPLLLSLLAVLSALHFAGFSHYVVSEQRGGYWRALFAALTFHINYREATTGYLPANWDILWSLSVEEAFYLGFPLVCRFARGAWLFVALFAFVAIGPFARTILAHGNELWSDYSYLSGMDAIALGCLTALFLDGRRLSRGALWACGTMGALMMAAVLVLPVHALYRPGLDMTVVAIGTCLVIVPAAQTRWIAPRFAKPVLDYGRRSYEVYLLHMFVVFAFFDWFVVAGKPMWAVPCLFIAAIAAAGAVGEIVGRFYSEPMNHWLRERSGSTS
jgi:peptidoglycan/LPS O-acetylase OafA/YrhL